MTGRACRDRAIGAGAWAGDLSRIERSMDPRSGLLTFVGAAVLVIGAAAQSPQGQPPLVKEGRTIKVSDHVYVIPDDNVPIVPNVGIIVGTKATLVVDTGLGPRNAETILREVAKVSRNAEGFL